VKTILENLEGLKDYLSGSAPLKTTTVEEKKYRCSV
jgi:hypothetical protein